MATPFEISDRFTESWADLDPIKATIEGIGGRDHLCTDFSPDGEAARNALFVRTRSDLAGYLDDPDPIQKRAAKVTVGWLDSRITDFENGKWKRNMNHIYSPFQIMRDAFDVMPTASEDHWNAICSRLEGFAGMLAGYKASLREGLSIGETVAVRQAESVREQAMSAASDESRFINMTRDAASVGYDSNRVEQAVDDVRAACREFASWLHSDYLPAARPGDAVGEERYKEGTDSFLGMDIDLQETYEWGWSEVNRIRAEMKSTAYEIDPSLPVAEVIDLMKTDPARSAGTRAEFVEFVSHIQQEAIRQLEGEHFDVPDELKVVTVNMAPPGGSLGAWYVGPSEDFSRPGSIWYAPGSRERLPYYQEVSTAYHEGFPGHHLQVGIAAVQADRVSRFHRKVIWYAGSGEGWALYAERLMDELGFFANPDYRLGLLASQLFRSVRVVVDIGSQLGFRIPSDAPLHAGEGWNYERAVDYMNVIGLQARDMSKSEVNRYFGWWGQAITYKVGEREILKIREQVKSRDGASFDLKGFHQKMLEAGAIRLDHLWEEML